MGFPKSICASPNDVICHGIPDSRVLRDGDVVSFDVSVFVDGVFGDNCGTVCVGDVDAHGACLLYTSPSPRDLSTSRMPSSA